MLYYLQRENLALFGWRIFSRRLSVRKFPHTKSRAPSGQFNATKKKTRAPQLI
jgi:hypothetical protein